LLLWANMEPLLTSVQTFLDLVRQPPELFQLPETWATFHECVAQLMRLSREADAGARNRVLQQLAAALAVADPFSAGRIAMACAALVEQGGDPALASDAILQHLPRQLRAAHAYTQTLAADLGIDRTREGQEERLARAVADRQNKVQILQELSMLLQPAMTMLCRHPAARQTACQDLALRDGAAALAPIHREAYFLARLLALTDGEELLVLHPEANKGFRVVLEAVQNNFHLFTLLQEALIGAPAEGKLEGPSLRTDVIATARGERPLHASDTDSAVWTFSDWAGLRPDGTWSPSAEGHWILGEGQPLDIPLFDGQRIVLLGPLQVPRSWDAQFFAPLHEALRSRVQVVEILPAATVADWTARIQRAPREPSA
jgi:hypothetical protein